ncbi:enoyl-CoA hydratase-related protein [Acinetobacter puyangensis]|uniref:enoyl-CoA hydratase-related protein n=1 Tax=Acinetobacter puyangensis TaxID=1096779 RepID=UPI003A4E312A
MQTEYECFEIKRIKNVAHLMLSRPQKVNSLGLSFWTDFPKAIKALNYSGEIRALVISGQGEVFCGGLDLNLFAQQQEFHAKDAVARESIIHALEVMQEGLSCLEKTRFPVIAAVHGACIGAGFDLIAACDFCFATEQAKFRIEETNIGMMADIGILQRLPHQIPLNLSRYFAYTGESLTADEAYRLGLVVKVLQSQEELIEHALKIATKIANKPPIAMQGIKKSITFSRDHGVPSALEHTLPLQAAILNGEDIMLAIQSRTTKHDAEYKNLNAITFAE